MGEKVFKTINEQIEILKSKGLIINDESYASDVVLRENYFFLNGYRHVLYRTDGIRKFIEGTTFEELYALFVFDRRFRNIIFKNLLIIENNYKSYFSYIMSKSYGYREKEYLNPKNFDHSEYKTRQINDLLRKLKRQIRVNGSQHKSTQHYMQNYGYIPMWVGIKVLSFGLVSEMYSILKYQDRQSIADLYKVAPEDLIVYLPILANYRNLCAHEDILFNNQTQRTVPDSKYHNLLNIEKFDSEYIKGKNDIFGLIIILKHLLSKDDFKMMMNEIIYEIEYLDAKINIITIDKMLEKMGFPENYKEIMYLE